MLIDTVIVFSFMVIVVAVIVAFFDNSEGP
jgi:hypothetical protein